MGHRPIDLHLKAMQRMGANIRDLRNGNICCSAESLVGADIHLDFPSVGATENIMLAAVMASGDTLIRNAAKEPEIVDLQNFLNKMGAKVSGAGTGFVQVEGTPKLLREVEHRVIPDRIVAGTYLLAAAMMNGEVLLTDVIPEHIGPVMANLRDSGCSITAGKQSIYITAPARPKALDLIRTMPYPGFPTDMQAQMVAFLSVSDGTSVVVENIFENRFKYVEELMRMGADIKIEGRMAIIKGVKRLSGATVTARDLRGGAALILAALTAEDRTTVLGVQHIDRGYENIEGKLASLGAIIHREIIPDEEGGT